MSRLAGSAPSVPWRPEPLEALRARYPAAVAAVIDQRDVKEGRRDPPSSDPTHVFDSEDGLRLIVSLERLNLADGNVGVHVSASFNPGSKLPTSVSSLADVNRYIVERWRAIAQSTRVAEFVGVSAGGVPHFFIERGN